MLPSLLWFPVRLRPTTYHSNIMTKKYRSRQTQATQRQLHWAYTTSSTCPTHQVQRLKSSQAVKSNKENNSTINSIFEFSITLIKLYIVEWLSLIRNSTKSDEETLHIRPHNSERKVARPDQNTAAPPLFQQRCGGGSEIYQISLERFNDWKNIAVTNAAFIH